MSDFIVKTEKNNKGTLIFKSEYCVRWSVAFWKKGTGKRLQSRKPP